MELRQLEYFVGVAEERHFTRAAEQLMVSQSGLSAAIRSLEDELGAPLFVRSTRSVDLTDVGKAFLPEARQTLARAAAAWSAVAEVQGLLRGTLTVGTVQCLYGVDLPALLDVFHEKYPAVEIHLIQDGTLELIGGVRDGSIDLAFVALGTHPVDDLEARVIDAGADGAGMRTGSSLGSRVRDPTHRTGRRVLRRLHKPLGIT